MSAEQFFDTNVILYLLSGDRAKADRAEALLAQGGTISVQVLDECADVASRKLKMTYAEIGDVLATVRAVCRVVPVTEEMHDLALGLADRHRFAFHDAVIVAASLLERCAVLVTEDLQDGYMVEGQLTISYPFRP
jgi:predicted nucleic acid-binding protein